MADVIDAAVDVVLEIVDIIVDLWANRKKKIK